MSPSVVAMRRCIGKGEDLFIEGALGRFFYKVISGTLFTGTLLADARRLIDAFHVAGDFFGFEPPPDEAFTAEAVENTVVLAFRRTHCWNVMQADPEFTDQIMSAMTANLSRARRHMMLLARRTPLERIALFLLDISERLRKGDRFDLPLHRSHIADHLGLTRETVCRTLSRMTRDGLIGQSSASRTILVEDRTGLKRLVLEGLNGTAPSGPRISSAIETTEAG
jgi:CRP/FNR family nitrogen fixation transcriptional regulator